MLTIGRSVTTFFPSRAAAEKIAQPNREADAESEYRVTEVAPGRFVIQIFADGEFVATL